MNYKEFAIELAKIDGRPYHPEDYEEFAFNILDVQLQETVLRRLNYLKTHHTDNVGWMEIECFFRTGKLYENYTYKLIYSEE